jgi:hypothetical protein
VLAHRLDVAGDGGEIDECFRVTVHGLTVCQQAGAGWSGDGGGLSGRG